jgi:hypothetical protein
MYSKCDLSEASLSVIHYLDRSLSKYSARMAELKSMIRFRSLGLEFYGHRFEIRVADRLSLH